MLRDVLADPVRESALPGFGRQGPGALVDCQGDEPAEALREIIGAHHVERREFLQQPTRRPESQAAYTGCSREDPCCHGIQVDAALEAIAGDEEHQALGLYGTQ